MLSNLLCCQEFYKEGDNIWFSDYTHNGIYRINEKTKEIHRLTDFPGEKGREMMLYKTVSHIKDWFVFGPCAAREIAVYNYKKNQMKKIPLQKASKGKMNQEEFRFWMAATYKDYVYLFGLRYPAIIRINPETEETVYYTKWAEELEQYITEWKWGYLSEGIVRGRFAYLPCFCTNAILKFDLDSGIWEFIEVPFKAEGIFGIGDDGRNLWLVSLEGQSIIKWNLESGAVKEIEIPNRNKVILPFHAPLLTDRTIYLFPFAAEDVYCIDMETETVERHKGLSDGLNTERRKFCSGVINVLNPKIIEDRIFYINGKDYSWHTYDVKTGRNNSMYWKLKGENFEYIAQLFMVEEVSQRKVFVEEQEIDLSFLLNCPRRDRTGVQFHIDIGNVGKKVFQSINNKLF